MRPLVVLAVLMIAAPALAQAPVPAALEAAFRGTVVSTYPDGRTAKAWVNADGSYRGEGRTGHRSAGRWTLKGDRICLRQSRPIPIPRSYCTQAPKAGETSWTGKAVTGEPIRITVAPGR